MKKITYLTLILVGLNVNAQKQILFDAIEEFKENGFAKVYKNKKVSYIDNKGKNYSEKEYLEAINTSENGIYISGLKLKSYGINEYEQNYNNLIKQGKKLLVEKKYTIRKFGNNFSSVFYEGQGILNKKKYCEIYNSNGLKISKTYSIKYAEKITPISENFYLDKYESSSYNQKSFAYLKSYKNDSIILKDVNTIFLAKEGLHKVQKTINNESKWGYLNLDGKIEIDFKFSKEPGDFKNGLAIITTQENKCGYINKLGEIIIKPKYEFVSPFVNGIALVKIKYSYDSKTHKTNNGFRLINLKDEIIFDFKEHMVLNVANKYEKYKTYKIEEDKILRTRLVNKNYIFNIEKLSYSEMKFNQISPFNSGLSRISYGRPTTTYGYINIKGELIYILSKDENEYNL